MCVLAVKCLHHLCDYTVIGISNCGSLYQYKIIAQLTFIGLTCNKMPFLMMRHICLLCLYILYVI